MTSVNLLKYEIFLVKNLSVLGRRLRGLQKVYTGHAGGDI